MDKSICRISDVGEGDVVADGVLQDEDDKARERQGRAVASSNAEAYRSYYTLSHRLAKNGTTLVLHSRLSTSLVTRFSQWRLFRVILEFVKGTILNGMRTIRFILSVPRFGNKSVSCSECLLISLADS